MFNLFKKKSSPPPPPPSDVRFEAFKEHWRQIRYVLETTGPWATQKSRESIESAVSSVRAHLNSLTELLVSELRESTSLGSVFEYCFEEQLFKRLCVWALQPGAYQSDRVVDQLRMYEALVADSQRCILHDKPFLQPLFALLAHHQAAPVHFEADEVVSQTLQSLCLWIGRDPTLLPVFFCMSEESQGEFLSFIVRCSY